VPSPGWKRDVQQTGSGEDAVVTKVTWDGGLALVLAVAALVAGTGRRSLA